MAKRGEWVGLAVAAHELSKGYWATRELMLKGLIEGRQNTAGGWEVSWASVQRYKVAQQRDDAA